MITSNELALIFIRLISVCIGENAVKIENAAENSNQFTTKVDFCDEHINEFGKSECDSDVPIKVPSYIDFRDSENVDHGSAIRIARVKSKSSGNSKNKTSQRKPHICKAMNVLFGRRRFNDINVILWVITAVTQQQQQRQRVRPHKGHKELKSPRETLCSLQTLKTKTFAQKLKIWTDFKLFFNDCTHEKRQKRRFSMHEPCTEGFKRSKR